MSDRERVVVKFGSESLVNGDGIDYERIDSHAVRLAPVYVENDLLIVTSGAVLRAKRRLEQTGQGWQGKHRRTLAMLGSAGISVAWEDAFEKVGLTAGQVLASHHELDDAEQAMNFLSSFEEAIEDGVIPVLNHNDFMAKRHSKQDELDKIESQKDNDETAREVAGITHASTLILATSGVDGFTTRERTLLSTVRVSEVEDLIESEVDEGENVNSTGGIDSKLRQAKLHVELGGRAYICSADADFAQMLEGERIGTEIIAA
ncbi:MAG: hypothetical protein ACHQT9_01890 [Candidatus Saccharimonadales bacterium]